MTPSIPQTPSEGPGEEPSLRTRLLLPIVMTPVLLIPLRSYSVEPVPAIIAVVVGLGAGVGVGAFLDRYRSTLERWNDGVVIVVFVVPAFLLLVGMGRLFGRGVLGNQAVGMVALLWGATLQNLLRP